MNAEKKAAKKEEARKELPFISVRCECGKTHGNYLGHYEILHAPCGRYFWVLQPTRNGPFVLKPWPGLPGAPIHQK